MAKTWVKIKKGIGHLGQNNTRIDGFVLAAILFLNVAIPMGWFLSVTHLYLYGVVHRHYNQSKLTH